MQNPTVFQYEQAVLAQREFEDLIDRLIREGLDYRSILTGVATAVTASITASAGADKVSIWFAQNSALTMNLGKDAH